MLPAAAAALTLDAPPDPLCLQERARRAHRACAPRQEEIEKLDEHLDVQLQKIDEQEEAIEESKGVVLEVVIPLVLAAVVLLILGTALGRHHYRLTHKKVSDLHHNHHYFREKMHTCKRSEMAPTLYWQFALWARFRAP